MKHDRLNVNVAHLSQQLDFDNADAVHPIGASHLSEYLTVMFGEEIPHDPFDRRYAARFMVALAEFSTDESLTELSRSDPIAYIPHWINKIEPVVDSTKRIGSRVEYDMRLIEARGKGSISNDFTYMSGLFDIGSFVLAAEFALPHPRFQHQQLTDRVKGVTPPEKELRLPKPADDLALELLIQLPIVKSEYRRKIAAMRERSKKIISGTESNFHRLQDILQG